MHMDSKVFNLYSTLVNFFFLCHGEFRSTLQFYFSLLVKILMYSFEFLFLKYYVGKKSNICVGFLVMAVIAELMWSWFRELFHKYVIILMALGLGGLG